MEELPNGTRLTLEDVGWSGIPGFLLSKLMMTPGWKKMLDHSIPGVLAELSDDGTLHPDSALTPQF